MADVGSSLSNAIMPVLRAIGGVAAVLLRVGDEHVARAELSPQCAESALEDRGSERPTDRIAGVLGSYWKLVVVLETGLGGNRTSASREPPSPFRAPGGPCHQAALAAADQRTGSPGGRSTACQPPGRRLSTTDESCGCTVWCSSSTAVPPSRSTRRTTTEKLVIRAKYASQVPRTALP